MLCVCVWACGLQVVDARSPDARAAATAFCQFLFTASAQQEFAKLGFRVNPKVARTVAAEQVRGGGAGV